MIIFHEGLPRSGKSYEAVVNQIIPALKKGRQVFAYIEGLNHEKFAEATGIPLHEMIGKTENIPVSHEQYVGLPEEQKRAVIKANAGWYRPAFTGLLHQIELEQVKSIAKYVANDSLVVIDEAQDHWPVSKAALGDEITTFVTQHGHRGLDIIIMGQDNRDCHSLWKRRIDQLFAFVKQDAIGRPSRYTWTSYKQNKGKFIKLNSGQGEYEEKYFGLYKSHTDGTLNKETKLDDRTNLFKSAGFRYGLPGALIVGVLAVTYLVRFFGGDASMVNLPKTETKTELEVRRPSPPVTVSEQKAANNPQLTYSHGNYIEEIITTTRPRLAAIIEGTSRINGGKVITAMIQFMDSSNHVKEQFTLPQLQAFGWGFQRTEYGIKLIKGAKDIAVTAWPIDIAGKVPQATLKSLDGKPG